MKHNVFFLLLLLASGHYAELNAVLDKDLLDPRSQVAAALIINDVKKIKAVYQELVKKHNISGVEFSDKLAFDTSRSTTDFYKLGFHESKSGKVIPVAVVTPLGAVKLFESYSGFDRDGTFFWLTRELLKSFRGETVRAPFPLEYDSDCNDWHRPVFRGTNSDAAHQLQFFKKCHPDDPHYEDLIKKLQNDFKRD